MIVLPTNLKITGAARDLLEKEGIEAVSMRRVGSAVGITPMAIYRHFPNRESLLVRVRVIQNAVTNIKISVTRFSRAL
jgi:AcrR family transcriptional regulator